MLDDIYIIQDALITLKTVCDNNPTCKTCLLNIFCGGISADEGLRLNESVERYYKRIGSDMDD